MTPDEKQVRGDGGRFTLRRGAARRGAAAARRRRERPPWIRLLRITGETYPWCVWWWPTGDACWACGVPAVMEGRMRRPGLACDEAGPTATGPDKHWHFFHIVARKR